MPTNYFQFLNAVQNPSRYVAGEYGLAQPQDDVLLRWVLAFPDVYEVGMSCSAVQLLYGWLNQQKAVSCERVFAPWVDAEAVLRAQGHPLSSLESFTPLGEFDVVGVSLQHEMNFTNLLTILDLGGLPLRSEARDHRYPLVIAGGNCTYNAEPIADFVDVVVVGDGEAVVQEINAVLLEHPPRHSPREDVLLALSQLKGVYIPGFYQVEYHPDGRVKAYHPNHNGLPLPVQPARVSLEGAYHNTTPLVPSCRIVHDRISVEVLRGCTHGCRFCQAGFINRPIRERRAEAIVQHGVQSLQHSGYDSLSLLSLSTADHSDIIGIIDQFKTRLADGIQLALPSLRLDSFSPEQAAALARLLPSGLTFAPEAGSQRLRNAINKDLSEEQILQTIEQVFRSGWKTVKLYFQVGLPTETDRDLDELVGLVHQVRDVLRTKAQARAQINVSVNPHIPKPFTPFQWYGQPELGEIQSKVTYLKSRLNHRPVKFNYHDPRLSLLEAAFARGDRRLSAVLEKAWQSGCRFENWSECFDFSLWQQAFETVGLDLRFYAHRPREQDELFPWEVVSCGVSREYLYSEWQATQTGTITNDCRNEGACSACGACPQPPGHELAVDLQSETSAPGAHTESPQTELGAVTQKGDTPNYPACPETDAPATEPVRSKWRLGFQKTGVARWLSHLDLQLVLQQTFRRANVPVAMSQGFSPHPRISFAMAAPVGVACHNEWIDLETIGDADEEQSSWQPDLPALSRNAPPGIVFRSAELAGPGAASLGSSVSAIRCSVTWEPGYAAENKLKANLAKSIADLQQGKQFTVERPARKQRPSRTLELNEFLKEVEVETTPEQGLRLNMTLAVQSGLTLRPEEVASSLFTDGSLERAAMEIDRWEIVLQANGNNGSNPSG